eukprot:6068768-Pyramimonas_sp.AAC.1
MREGLSKGRTCRPTCRDASRQEKAAPGRQEDSQWRRATAGDQRRAGGEQQDPSSTGRAASNR